MRNENCDRKSSCDDYKHNHCDGCGGNKPKGDLISRKALKEEMNKKALDLANGGMIFIETINNVIDNAPTVEPFERIGAICNENCGFYRSQGEWIETNSYDENIICSFCKTEFNGDLKLVCGGENPYFCPNCGAKMVGGES